MSIDPIVQQLIDARVRAGRTQREVAAFAGVAQNTLSDAEAGKTEPRLGTLRRWAAALDLEPTLVGPGSTSPEPGPHADGYPHYGTGADGECMAHGAHPHAGMTCLDCPICRPAEPTKGGTE